MDLKGRSFLKLLDYTPEEIGGLIRLAAQLKAEKKAGTPHDLLRGKNIALIFEKTSTRTRCSFEVAAHDLGMGVTLSLIHIFPTGPYDLLRRSDDARLKARVVLSALIPHHVRQQDGTRRTGGQRRQADAADEQNGDGLQQQPHAFPAPSPHAKPFLILLRRTFHQTSTPVSYTHLAPLETVYATS